MNRQLEAIRKQSLHHQSKLVLGRVARMPAPGCHSDLSFAHFGSCRLDSLQLFGRQLVRKNHVLKQRKIR